MRKMKAVVLSLICVSSLVGCVTQEPNNQVFSTESSETRDISSSEFAEITDITECLIEERGAQYLILPISREKIMIMWEQKDYIDKINFDLLKAAEEKISEEIAQHSENSGFYLEVVEGHLNLCVEVIVELDPPVDTGCGDHEHKFFRERITK